jgi:hypothetical protein
MGNGARGNGDLGYAVEEIDRDLAGEAADHRFEVGKAHALTRNPVIPSGARDDSVHQRPATRSAT